jgi:hypothetical protein
MPPTVAEVVDLVVRLEDDENRRQVLDGSPYGFFRAAVDDGLVAEDAIDSFAMVIGYAVKQGAVGFRAQHGGTRLPDPDAIWTDHAFQSRIGYFSTLAGQQMAALYRQRRKQDASEPSTEPTERDGRERDVFLCHASEDKDSVARPLAQALQARGWSVWLDELELTLGDSLSRNIDAALARCRFGVAVLSPASFAKEWPQRELAGLAAREVDAGSKIILPVWHEVDHHYIVHRSPILADRIGASTSTGIDNVANKISVALERAGMHALTGLAPAPVVQSVEPEKGTQRLSIPRTAEEQASMIDMRPKWWEYRLYAGALVQGKKRLETKWDDHELRLPGGARREVAGPDVLPFIKREIHAMSKQVGVLGRILDLKVQEQAFGAEGEAGDPVRIEALAGRIITLYDGLLDWAAALRNTTVPEVFEEAVEATACMVDAPIAQIRDFIDAASDQISRLPELAAAGTNDEPVKLRLMLTLAQDPAVMERYEHALDTLDASPGATSLGAD